MSDTIGTTARFELMSEAEKSSGLVELITAVLRDKLFLLLSGIVFAGLALLITLLMPPQFTAHVEMLPPQMSQGGATSALLARGAGSDAGGLGGLASALQQRKDADTFVAILDSWPIQDALVKQFHLVNVYHASSVDQARKTLAMHTSVGFDRDGGFISIDVSDKDRQLAASIANSYVDGLRNTMREFSLSMAMQQREFYQTQLSESKGELTQAEDNFKLAQQKSGLLTLDSKVRSLIETAATIRAEITAKEVALQDIRSYSTENNPRVQMAETDLSALRAQLAQVESQDQGGGFSGGTLSGIPTAELEFARASRDLKYQETLYDLMVREYEVARLNEASDGPVVQVIEPALPPEHKSSPKRLQIVLMAFVFGFFLRILLVIFLFWKSRLDEPGRATFTEISRAAFHWSR